MAHGRARVHGRDENDVSRVKRDRGVKGLVEAGHMSTMGVTWWPSGYERFGWFGSQNHHAVKFTGLGLKTEGMSAIQCGRMAMVDGTWRHHEVFIEAKKNREGRASVRCFEKNLDGLREGYLGYVIHVRVFWTFARRLYI